MTLGDKIYKLRTDLGITQTALAKKLSVSNQTLYKYEKGIVTNIPLDVLSSIAKALQTTPSYLMGWEDKKTTAATDEIIDKHFIKKYNKLDNIDKGKTEAYVDGLLDNEKYKKGVGLLDA